MMEMRSYGLFLNLSVSSLLTLESERYTVNFVTERKFVQCCIWMDEVGFYVPSTVFQSFRDDERVNMKGSVQ